VIERVRSLRRPGVASVVVAACLVVLVTYIIYPIVLLLALSFNTAERILVPPPVWGLSNWVDAWQFPGLLESILHSFQIWFLVSIISFPLAIVISLTLARTNIHFSHKIEALFWVAYIFPSIASTFGWVILLDPAHGFLNRLVELLPGVDKGPFNIFSVPGIVWARIMGDGLAFKVILLTPAFRNMDGALEEASRVSGASNIRTMLRVTIPVMAAPIVLTLSLQLLRVFQGFETEWIIGARFGYFVYSTLIYRLVRLNDIPQYGDAVVLGSITLLIIAAIVPLQRWIVGRRQYTTVDAGFRPGLFDLGRWRKPITAGLLSIIGLLTALPIFVLIVGSFMTRIGFFNAKPVFTLNHWIEVFSNNAFQSSVFTTLSLAIAAGIFSPLLFSLLAYVIVRTKQRGRGLIDAIIWASASLPGILVGLGLLLMFLTTPFLKPLFGTIWVLVIVVIVSGVTTGVNVLKGVMVQLGASLEEAGRVAGAGWIRTYFRIVVPVMMPTMVLIGMLNFVSAASTTSTIVLLASTDTTTLSLLALQYGAAGSKLEEAGIISLAIMVLTLGVALPFRVLAARLGVRHDLTTDETSAARFRGEQEAQPRGAIA
jgi:iron(III) transport system permease protein